MIKFSGVDFLFLSKYQVGNVGYIGSDRFWLFNQIKEVVYPGITSFWSTVHRCLWILTILWILLQNDMILVLHMQIEFM